VTLRERDVHGVFCNAKAWFTDTPVPCQMTKVLSCLRAGLPNAP